MHFLNKGFSALSFARYVAWFICLTSIFTSVFFIWAYGVQFGDEKTRKWITSLLVSFFTSVLVTQPIKVPDLQTADSETLQIRVLPYKVIFINITIKVVIIQTIIVVIKGRRVYVILG